MNSWHLWAKTEKSPKDEPERWHALPWHLLEVGAVAQLLWQKSIPKQSKNRICTRLGIDDDQAVKFIGFLAALHDFGKASPRFQSMSRKQSVRLELLYPKSFKRQEDNRALRHSLISWGLLVPILEEEFGWTSRISQRYSEITAAHHGRFWDSGDYRKLGHTDSIKRTGQKTWTKLHLEIFHQLRDAFGIEAELIARLNADLTNEPNFPTYEDSLWLAGLISVADWIGSDEHYFCFRSEPATSYSAGLTIARESAEKALRFTGWESPPLQIDASSFETAIKTLPAGAQPNAAQSQAIELTRNMTSPGMTVVEIPMGWGKTEIALWMAAYYAEHASITGTYFALPTMATSDQLYQRVYAHLDAHVKATDRKRIVPLHLLHGMAEFSVMDELESDAGGADTLQAMAERLDSQHDVDNTNVVRQARWFTRKKHGLLAHHGVGTVDQALMSILLSPHLFVRMFGLSGKTVIFDEVHSYDVYMSKLFERLLEFLGALGSPVVILSATLPQARTRSMLGAYAKGARWDVEAEELAPYPRITAIDDTHMQSITIEPDHRATPTTIHLEWFPTDPDDMWSTLATRLQHELQEGGTVAIICNTVSSAQACFTHLQQSFGDDELTLFHARFRQKERAAIQKRVLHLFGKDAGEKRPSRHIVVATQVIEQSLDLDFDLMVSMFAPTDLLLQRAGRLQRHRQWDSQRPDAFHGRARLWLIGLDSQDATDGPEFFTGSQHVYGEYVLLRSWLALAGREHIVIPNDVETLIEATYGDELNVPPGMTDRYVESEAKWHKDTSIQKSTSETALVPKLARERDETRTDVLVRLGQVKNDPEDSPEAHRSRLALTRLGPPTISLVILSAAEVAKLWFTPEGNADTPFTKEEIRELLHSSVSVSNYDVVRATIDMDLSPTWAGSAHLRHRRLILLDDDGQAEVGNSTIHLDDRLGVLITRNSDEDQTGDVK